MPTQRTLKGYDHEGKRWYWMIDRKRVGVTLKELGLPESQWTQEGSRAAAWKRYCELKAEVAKHAEAAHPHAEQIAVLTRRQHLAQSLGINATDLVADLAELKSLKEGDDAPALTTTTAERIKAFELMTGKTISDLDPIVLESFFGASDVWGERQSTINNSEVAKTIGLNAKRYIDGKAEESRKGLRSSDGADNIRRWVNKFVDFMGELAATNSIDFQKWEKWQTTCKAKTKNLNSEEGLKDYQHSKAFVRWMWKQDLCDLPKNFTDRVKFEYEVTEPAPYPIADVKKVLKLATGKLRCFLLLMLNCGMTQKDCSDLLKSQVNLEHGRITRKRSKTKSKKGTPLVSYKLWPETIAAIRTCWSDHETLCFLTKSKQPWLRKSTLENGKIKKTDNIATLWGNLKKKNPEAEYLGDLISFKKSSSTLLRNNKHHSTCFRYFLGHSEANVAEKRYAGLTQENFDDACNWLAKQYGLKS